jgi:1-deoxy-D-xylulose-5-phosphate synthase
MMSGKWDTPPPRSLLPPAMLWRGIWLARQNKVVAVIGDGSMTGGIAFEGLNHAGHLNRDLVVVLNDNEMSIAENVGAVSGFLSRTSSSEFIHKFKRETEQFIKHAKATWAMGSFRLARKIENSFKGAVYPCHAVSGLWI